MAPSHVATLLTFKQMIKKKTNAYKGKKVVKLPEQASQLHEDASANLSLSDYQCFSLNREAVLDLRVGGHDGGERLAVRLPLRRGRILGLRLRLRRFGVARVGAESRPPPQQH